MTGWEAFHGPFKHFEAFRDGSARFSGSLAARIGAVAIAVQTRRRRPYSMVMLMRRFS